MKSLRVLLFCLLLIATWHRPRARAPGSKPSTTSLKRARRVESPSTATAACRWRLSFSALYTSPSTYLWDLASDAEGNIYAAAGSPARVYKITPEVRPASSSLPRNCRCRRWRLTAAARSTPRPRPTARCTRSCAARPLGKAARSCARKLQVSQPARTARPAVAVDPSYSASVFFDPKTKYIWTLALDKQGRLLHRHG